MNESWPLATTRLRRLVEGKVRTKVRAGVIKLIAKVLGDIRKRVVFPADQDVLGSRVLVSKGFDGILGTVGIVAIAVVVNF